MCICFCLALIACIAEGNSFSELDLLVNELISAITVSDLHTVEKLGLSLDGTQAVDALNHVQADEIHKSTDYGLYLSPIGFSVVNGHMNFLEFFVNLFTQDVLGYAAAVSVENDESQQSQLSPLALSAFVDDVEMFMFLSHYAFPHNDRSNPSVIEMALQSGSCRVIAAWTHSVFIHNREETTSDLLQNVLGDDVTLGQLVEDHLQRVAGTSLQGDMCAVSLLLHINSVPQIGDWLSFPEEVSIDLKPQNDILLGSILADSFRDSQQDVHRAMKTFSQGVSQELLRMQSFIHRIELQRDCLQRRVDEQDKRIIDLEKMVAHLQQQNAVKNHRDEVYTAVVDTLMMHKYI